MKNNPIVKYFVGAWNELKKVSWPTKREVVYHTIIVFVVAVIAIGITSVLDYGLAYLVQLIVERNG
jgi:preprotein translocase subunit SecE